MTFSVSPSRNRFQKETAKVFRYGNCRQHGMIGRLLEPAQPSGGPPGVDKRIGDCLRKSAIAYVMGARKSRQQAILRQQLERAHVQFPVATQALSQSPPGFCKP